MVAIGVDFSPVAIDKGAQPRSIEHDTADLPRRRCDAVGSVRPIPRGFRRRVLSRLARRPATCLRARGAPPVGTARHPSELGDGRGNGRRSGLTRDRRCVLQPQFLGDRSPSESAPPRRGALVLAAERWHRRLTRSAAPRRVPRRSGRAPARPQIPKDADYFRNRVIPASANTFRTRTMPTRARAARSDSLVAIGSINKTRASPPWRPSGS